MAVPSLRPATANRRVSKIPGYMDDGTLCPWVDIRGNLQSDLALSILLMSSLRGESETFSLFGESVLEDPDGEIGGNVYSWEKWRNFLDKLSMSCLEEEMFFSTGSSLSGESVTDSLDGKTVGVVSSLEESEEPLDESFISYDDDESVSSIGNIL